MNLVLSWAGVVVTYNRKDELKKNLDAISQQEKKFDRYYIVDNGSTDGTYSFLISNNYLSCDSIVYIKLDTNIGGAGGFYTGMKRAYEDGYDLICLMDDDGRPENKKTFKLLYNEVCDAYAVNHCLMMGPLVISEMYQTSRVARLSFGLNDKLYYDEVKCCSKNNLYKDFLNPFNGTVISKELISKIGFVNKSFFIRGDEVDYQNRAKKSGAFIATVMNSFYYHPSAELKILKWRGQMVIAEPVSPWKSYYLMRNKVYQRKRDEGLLGALKSFVFIYYCTQKINPQYKKVRPFLIKGFLDGLKGKLGKVVQPGQETL